MKIHKNPENRSKLIRLSSAGFQMGIVIAGFAWLGDYLDDKYHNETPGWTIGLSLFGVFAGLYLMIKEVISITKEDDK